MGRTKESTTMLDSVVLGWPTIRNDEIEVVVNRDVKSIKGTVGWIRKRSVYERRIHYQALRLESLVQIDIRNGTESDEWDNEFEESSDDPSQVEMVLPQLLYNQKVEYDRWQALFRTTSDDGDDDDQWAAAKRGDLDALKKYAGIDWTKEDAFGSPPLYYACHSGAAKNLQVVKYLFEAWPGDVPPALLQRCRENAINNSVVHLLNDPTADVTKPETEAAPFYRELSCLVEGWNIFEEDEIEE